MSTQLFLSQFLNGITFGALLFVLASGFSLAFGLMRIVNLAHGAFYLVGGYLALTVVRSLGTFWGGVAAGALGIMVLGMLTERALLSRIRGQAMPEILLTVGLAIALGDLCLWMWGGEPRRIPPPSYLTGAVELGELVYPRFRLFVLLVAVAVGLGLYVLLYRTRIGLIVRAGVDDREMVSAMGIDVQRVSTLVFGIGALLAGFAGALGGSFLTLLPGVETEILVFGLVVVIIGGLGSIPGAAIGAALVGLFDAFGRSLVPELSYFVLFAPMAVILMLRPQGLMGRPS